MGIISERSEKSGDIGVRHAVVQDFEFKGCIARLRWQAPINQKVRNFQKC